MTITGNMGLGTSTPGAKLDIAYNSNGLPALKISGSFVAAARNLIQLTNTDTSTILRFVAGLLSSSAPAPTPNTKTYGSLTNSNPSFSNSSIAGYVPQNLSGSDLVYLNSKGFADTGSTIFNGVGTVYTTLNPTYTFSSVFGGSTTVSSSADPQLFGSWVGASVHDVAQVIATSSTGGDPAVQAATVVKLSRVVLLAPLVACVSIWVRRSSSGLVAKAKKADKTRVSVVPLFVIGFLVMIAVRTTGIIPENLLSKIKTIEQVCLASALVGLGSDVRIAKLIKVGGRPLLLALISWFGIAVVSLIGVRLVA
jgi:hypothetical protein